MNTKNDLNTLRTRLREISYLSSTSALLGWDQKTNAPQQSHAHRAEALAYLGTLAHQKFLAINEDDLIDRLSEAAEKGMLSPRDRAMVREVARDLARIEKLPETFVREYVAVTAEAEHVWEEARARNDFAIFAPWLKKVVDLTRTRAALLGDAQKPYDALLDEFEPGMTAETVSIVFAELREALVPLVEAIAGSRVSVPRLKGRFPVESQKAFGRMITEAVGFDYTAGRIDESTHPFSSGFHPRDVRITSRYSETDVMYSIGSALHEAGHALYEQGLPYALLGTPLAESVSLAVHESQSRFWQNMVGMNKHFWKFAYPKLKKAFPEALKEIPLNDFYRAIHRVERSLIRTESDEVTYNLHIIVRFELEKALVEGAIAVKDLPHLWNQKMKEYLGVTVPDDARGVLQDVHWSGGAIGYFPTYALGNLYSAQIYESMRNDIPEFDHLLAEGNFAPILAWLRKKIHRHGRQYQAEELMRRATGSPLAVAPFMNYLKEKYRPLYNLN